MRRGGARQGLWRRAILIVGIACLFAVNGCHCKKTDEEVLRERIDTTSVYLYVATKIAITKADGAPEVAEARKQLLAVLEVIDKGLRAKQAGMSAPPAGSAAVVPAASAAPALSGADYAKLAVALYKLRGEGKDIVRSGREDGLAPILPVLLGGMDLPPDVVSMFDLNTEHALFLTTFFALKFHEKSPAPIPPEILLYEAWMTRSGSIKLDGLGPLVQSIKAFVYGTNELCDLAAAEGAIAEGMKDDPEAMSATFRRLSGGRSSFEAKQAITLNAAARGLTHGMAAVCYLQRDQREKAVDELDKFVKAAHDLGTPPEETAMVRAYIAFEKGDHDAAKRCLEEARDSAATDPETKKQIEELLPHLAKNDDGAIRKYYGKTYFALFTVEWGWRRLERAGVIDALAEIEVVKRLRSFGQASSGAIGDAKKAIPSFEDAKQKGAGLLDKIKR